MRSFALCAAVAITLFAAASPGDRASARAAPTPIGAAPSPSTAAASAAAPPASPAPPAALPASAAAPPAPPPGMEFDSYYIVFLRRPAKPSQYEQSKLEEIQQRHLAHLGDLYRAGKALTAGPFDEQDDASVRGLIVMPAMLGKDEVRKLASEDPAVKAGRLEVEIVRWYTQKGTAVFPHPDAPMPR